jgi:hypothetical protein
MQEYRVKVYEDRTEWRNSKGRRHRESGPAVEWVNGTKEWWVNGKRHREGGPAIEWADGDKEWWLNGQLHREDGPAIEWSDGYKEWWLNGKRLTEEEWCQRTQPVKELTVAQISELLGYDVKVVKG